MSKAFTRESDASGDDDMHVTRPPLPPGTKNYITPEGAERLRERLKALLEKKAHLQSSEIDLRKLESNIRVLQQTLNSVVIAQPPPNSEVVAFGATVRLRDQNGQDETYRIVGVDEADPDRNLISWLSP